MPARQSVKDPIMTTTTTKKRKVTFLLPYDSDLESDSEEKENWNYKPRRESLRKSFQLYEPPPPHVDLKLRSILKKNNSYIPEPVITTSFLPLSIINAVINSHFSLSRFDSISYESEEITQVKSEKKSDLELKENNKNKKDAKTFANQSPQNSFDDSLEESFDFWALNSSENYLDTNLPNRLDHIAYENSDQDKNCEENQNSPEREFDFWALNSSNDYLGTTSSSSQYKSIHRSSEKEEEKEEKEEVEEKEEEEKEEVEEKEEEQKEEEEEKEEKEKEEEKEEEEDCVPIQNDDSFDFWATKSSDNNSKKTSTSNLHQNVTQRLEENECDSTSVCIDKNFDPWPAKSSVSYIYTNITNNPHKEVYNNSEEEKTSNQIQRTLDEDFDFKTSVSLNIYLDTNSTRSLLQSDKQTEDEEIKQILNSPDHDFDFWAPNRTDDVSYTNSDSNLRQDNFQNILEEDLDKNQNNINENFDIWAQYSSDECLNVNYVEHLSNNQSPKENLCHVSENLQTQDLNEKENKFRNSVNKNQNKTTYKYLRKDLENNKDDVEDNPDKGETKSLEKEFSKKELKGIPKQLKVNHDCVIPDSRLNEDDDDDGVSPREVNCDLNIKISCRESQKVFSDIDSGESIEINSLLNSNYKKGIKTDSQISDSLIENCLPDCPENLVSASVILNSIKNICTIPKNKTFSIGNNELSDYNNILCDKDNYSISHNDIKLEEKTKNLQKENKPQKKSVVELIRSLETSNSHLHLPTDPLKQLPTTEEIIIHHPSHKRRSSKHGSHKSTARKHFLNPSLPNFEEEGSVVRLENKSYLFDTKTILNGSSNQTPAKRPIRPYQRQVPAKRLFRVAHVIMENTGNLNCAGDPEVLSPSQRDDIKEKDILIWIYNMIDEPARVDYEFFLKDGCILCKLMNRIKPECIPEDEITWEGVRSKQKNISNFLIQAEKYGVPQAKLFFPEDLLHLRHIPRVTRCIYALAKIAQEDPALGSDCPKLGDEPNFLQQNKKVEIPGHRDTKDVLSQITASLQKKEDKKSTKHSLYK